MPIEPIIFFDRIQKTFIIDFKRNKKVALSGLTFHLTEGEVFGIVGPNGAGKSTALKILMGFMKYDSGEVRLAGKDPALSSAHSSLGYLPETPCLYENLTVREQLLFAGRVSRYRVQKTNRRIEEVLELVDLQKAANEPIRRYSKGMTQRAALAYALFHEPKILILDEPMSGLDPLGRQMVVDIIRDYNKRGNTILFCSHVLTDVERICNRIGIMNKGRLAAIITPNELRKDASALEPTHFGASPLETFF